MVSGIASPPCCGVRLRPRIGPKLIGPAGCAFITATRLGTKTFPRTDAAERASVTPPGDQNRAELRTRVPVVPRLRDDLDSARGGLSELRLGERRGGELLLGLRHTPGGHPRRRGPEDGPD